MLSAASRRLRLPLPPLILLCLFGVARGEATLDSVRGHIVEVFEDGHFRLEEGLLVRRASSTSIVRGKVPYAGELLVGLEVNVTGELDSTAGILEAGKVSVLTELEDRAEGTAVVEERQEMSSGIVLLADGRRLLVTDDTLRIPPEGNEPDLGQEANELQPGAFVRYRGRWTEAGSVLVEELAAWNNPLEEKEKKIYQQYRPDMLLPATVGAGPAVLKIHKNRYHVLGDREVQQYAERLGTRLLPAIWRDSEVAKRFGSTFWFIVAVHERPQASAFPSGVVVAHTALLHLAENEAQLAFALAHEIAHVTQEHAWREYQYQRGKLLLLRWSTAGLGYVVEMAIRRGYQRDLEAQADRLALWYMRQAGYDPREALGFLRQLKENQESLSALLWDTHRSYGARISALRKELVRYSQQGLQYASLSRNGPEFLALRERVPSAKIKAVR